MGMRDIDIIRLGVNYMNSPVDSPSDILVNDCIARFRLYINAFCASLQFYTFSNEQEALIVDIVNLANLICIFKNPYMVNATGLDFPTLVNRLDSYSFYLNHDVPNAYIDIMNANLERFKWIDLLGGQDDDTEEYHSEDEIYQIPLLY